MEKTKNILVVRFSAFGDVAMTLPALYSAAKAHPNHNFYMLTTKHFKDMFLNQLPNIKVIGVNLKQYDGVNGLIKLSKHVHKEYRIDAVADLHDVLRSQVIRTYFALKGKPVQHIHKERGKKKAITKHKSPLTPLKHSIERYTDVFKRLGYGATMSFTSYFEHQHRNLDELEEISFDVSKKNIGIAPFAMHPEKMYPIEKMEDVVKTLASNKNTHLYLFGGGGKEKQILDGWQENYPNVTSVVGKLTLHHELLLISHLSTLVSMDSANMHLASLVNTPVVSIWGATHPYLGFYGYNQSADNAIQLEDLKCRPCSVFGNKPCWRGDHACMQGISTQTVINKVLTVAEKSM